MSEIITAGLEWSAESERVEFGFNRTECACANCVANCRHLPGYLIPADVSRISQHLGQTNLVEFAAKHLLASPGATVMQAGSIFQIPTIIPQRKS